MNNNIQGITTREIATRILLEMEDADLAELFTYIYKHRVLRSDDWRTITADDINNMDIDNLTETIREDLQEIIHCPDIDEGAWFKKGE